MSPAVAPQPGPHNPGELFLGEIREQPQALLRLLEQEADFEAVAKVLRERRPSVVRLVGHGSSDAAASYGVYAFGLLPGWTAMRDSISLTVYYDAKLDLSDSVIIALSQSGETPDVVEYVKRARGRGAFTVAITSARSPRRRRSSTRWRHWRGLRAAQPGGEARSQRGCAASRSSCPTRSSLSSGRSRTSQSRSPTSGECT
jgi:DNA-binding MurR/RpiR family transcriptional regulator